MAFGKFSQYQLSKWDRDAAIKLKDVGFLTHPAAPKPLGKVYAQLMNKTFYPEATKSAKFPVKRTYELGEYEALESADTWEVALSAGGDKRTIWERLLQENKLGYMALLMNLRNMEQVHVDRELVELRLIEGAPKSRALPFRFVSAAKHAPAYAQALSDAMVMALAEAPKLKGRTALVVDVSGSMEDTISGKSQLTRLEAAGALAVLLREVCEGCRVFTFSNALVEVANYRGLPMIGGIAASQDHSGTHLGAALIKLQGYLPQVDRIIVVTDEQSADGNGRNWATHGYICNVAPYKPGLELHGGWSRVNGWSERIVDWIRFDESINSDR
jgi:hypothetical protein